MTGRVALVTGGGRGIGAAVARTLMADGDVVVVADAFGQTHSGYVLADESDRHRAQEDGIVCLAADLRDPLAAEAVGAQVLDRFKHLDLVICCASVIDGGRPLWETEVTVAEELWRSNALTVWNTARATVPALLRRPEAAKPTFIALTSVADHVGLFGLSAYVTAKHAAAGVIRALAADLAGTAVTACAVAPGATDTAMLQHTAELYGLHDMSELAASQRGGTPLTVLEVAAVVVAASRAGRVLHGATIPADGGFGRG